MLNGNVSSHSSGAWTSFENRVRPLAGFGAGDRGSLHQPFLANSSWLPARHLSGPYHRTTRVVPGASGSNLSHSPILDFYKKYNSDDSNADFIEHTQYQVTTSSQNIYNRGVSVIWILVCLFLITPLLKRFPWHTGKLINGLSVTRVSDSFFPGPLACLRIFRIPWTGKSTRR